jgi:DNA-binding transcriptional regulator/RsmH inhibitor MraZ
MYFNQYIVQTDRQGRITLPKNLFRIDGIERGGILCVYPISEYWMACDPKRILHVMETNFPGSAIDSVVRDSRREFMAEVQSIHIDPQGRVQFHPGSEKESSGKYVLIGTGYDFEIWPFEDWQEQTGKKGGSDE